ncbi:ATP-dependent RNA helicase-like protein dbp8 [Aureobasidium subglaciale]|nr:ATP-dependent RNA helicase-like protein dbp8 [Aureobasidium subglaciale]
MPSSIASSDSGNSSDSAASSVHNERKEVNQNGSRKRRRLSPTGSEDSDSEVEVQQKAVAAPMTTTSRIQPTATATISRIKARSTASATANGSSTQDAASTISAAQKGNEKSTFADLNVSPWLVASLANMAIKNPTRIQSAAIPEILSGRDCIGGSRTGSGKTVAFAVPILQQWSKDPFGIFGLVLTPTRELALQIFEQFKAIGAVQNLKVVLVTGGSDMRAQAIALAARPHIVIATPGRLADHVNSSGEESIAGLRRVKFVVLDEADRLLASGKGSMLPDLGVCMEVLPESSKRQTCLFTATVTAEVRALQDKPRTKGKPPVAVCEVDLDTLAVPDTLHQTYCLVNVVHKEKYLHVLLLTEANVKKSTIIFVNRTSTANLLEHLLRSLDHRVTSLHSALPQSDRTNNLARFRAGAARIMVCTDVAARGLDIPEVGLVVNYDLPRDPDDYVHRVGRTARAGRKGVSISLVGQRDVGLVQAIEGRVKSQMEEYVEEGVNVESRVVRDALNVVGDKKREALLAIEEGRDVKGKRRKGARGVQKA